MAQALPYCSKLHASTLIFVDRYTFFNIFFLLLLPSMKLIYKCHLACRRCVIKKKIKAQQTRSFLRLCFMVLYHKHENQ